MPPRRPALLATGSQSRATRPSVPPRRSREWGEAKTQGKRPVAAATSLTRQVAGCHCWQLWASSDLDVQREPSTAGQSTSSGTLCVESGCPLFVERFPEADVGGGNGLPLAPLWDVLGVKTRSGCDFGLPAGCRVPLLAALGQQ